MASSASAAAAPALVADGQDSSSSAASREQEEEQAVVVAAEARALLEAAVRDTIETWRAEEFSSRGSGKAFDPSEDVLVVLSGGVDSSITFHLAASLFGVRHCVTLLAAAAGDAKAATDAPWCRAVAAHVAAEALAPRGLALDHEVLTPTLPDLLDDDMPFLVQTLQSFDPMALRNSVAITRVLKHARARGFRHVLTGDAADELLAGYSFSSRLPEAEWKGHRQGMVARMHFDAVDVGRALGISVASPYLAPAFLTFALGLHKDDCVGPVFLRPTPDAPLDATPTVTGKLPIRRAFPTLPSASRRKDPVEIGCGTTLLGAAPWATPPRPHGYFEGRISDAVWEAERAEAKGVHGVALRDKEHLAYFRLFVARFQEGRGQGPLCIPGKPRPNDDPCPACGFALPHARSTFCLTCGHYEARLEFRHGKAGEEEES